MKKIKHNQGIAPMVAIIIGLIFGAVIIVGIVAIQKKAPVSEEPIFVPVEETLMEEVTEEEIIFQKSHEWGGFTFNYPSNWELTENMYTTPAGFTDVVGLSIKPIDQVSQNDYISVGGRQASCSVFPASQGYICNEMNFPPVYTQSTNPIILDFYSKLIQDLQKQTTQTACSPSDPPSITVINPKAGDVYTVGQQVIIKWTSCNIPSDNNITIFLDGFEGMNSLRYNTNVSVGSYTWTIPDMSAWNLPSYNLGFNVGGVHALSGTFSIQ